jgi:hypothetical protein
MVLLNSLVLKVASTLKLCDNLLGILVESVKSDSVVGTRNNVQMLFGVSSLNLKTNTSEGEHKAKPQMSDGTSKVAEYLVTMTEVAKILKLDLVSILESNDEKVHLNTFDRKIHLRNIFPGCTVDGITMPCSF